MQPRYRNSSDGFRSGSSFGRNRYRGGGGGGGGGGGFNRNYSKSYSNNTPPASRKFEILMEAGRLAAEYLIAKGVLSPNALPDNLSTDGSSVREFRGQGRENSYPSQFGGEGRISAIARLGDSGSDVGYRKRRLDDDYDLQGSQRNGRGRKKMGYNSRGYGSDWGRERGRNDSWNERSRGYSGSIEDEDDFAPIYRRERQGGNDDVGSSISHTAGDEQHSKTEAVGESGSELDDTGSKASSNSTKKDAVREVGAEVDADLSKEMDLEVNADLSKEMDSEVGTSLGQGLDVTKVLNVEAGDVKGRESNDLDKKASPSEEVFHGISDVNADNSVNKFSIDPMKLCNFAKVPRRPRSVVVHKGSLLVKSLHDEEAKKVEDATGEEYEVAAVTAPLKESPTAYDEGSVCKIPASSGSAVDNSGKETLELPTELEENLQHVELPVMVVDEISKVVDQKEPERKISSFSANAFQENDLSQPLSARLAETGMVNEIPSQDAGTIETPIVEDVPPLGVGITETSSVKETPSQDVEMMEAVEQVKPILVAKLEANLYARTQRAASFKICDLNLMEAPEITEIPDDIEDSHISASPLEAGDQLPADFGPSASNINAINSYEFNNSSADEKVIQVIDLEDDNPSEMNVSCESTKPKNESVYTGIENVLNQVTHGDDLHVMQENYGLGISDYLGADMPCSPSVQAGMGLPGPEGFAVVDDSIYGSLSDIGFMEVWDDQPAHEYEKFF